MIPAQATLYKVDIETGETTTIGNMTGDITSGVNAITYDHNTETFYIATDTQLATINIETGATSLVGTFGIPGGLMIEIAFDEAGNLYGIDLGTDRLYSINKETAAVSEIGPLGFDLNFGAGSSYDRVNGIYYLYGINVSNSPNVNQLRVVNLETGETTPVYTWPTITQFAAFDLMPVFKTNVLNITQTKGYSTIADAIYDAESGDIIKISSGTYTETYTTDGKGGLGFEFGDSTGCVDVIGNVTYNEGDILTFEISGTVPEPGLGDTNPCLYHDQHNITGTLTLNNPQLNVSFINSFKPGTGDSFVIITADELAGQFSTQLIQKDGVNMVLTHDYEKGEIILTTVAPVFRLEMNSGR